MRRLGILMLAFILLLAGCQKTTTKSYQYTMENGLYYTQTDALTIELEERAVSDQERDAAVQCMDEAFLKAQAFLGEAFSQEEEQYCYLHAGDGVSQVLEDGLHIYYYGDAAQPYVNYMIQLLAGGEVPDWFYEGLAAYGANQAGETLLTSYALEIAELDEWRSQEKPAGVTELAKTLYQANVHVQAAELGDMIEAIALFSEAQEAREYRAAYCIYAGSFVEYLVEQYGKEAVLQEYQKKDQFTDTFLEQNRQKWIKERLTESA